jgi:hypothetical protein
MEHAMNARNLLILSTLLAATTLTACGGGGAAGGGNTLPPSAGNGNSTQSAQQQTEDAVNTANDVGTPMKDFSSYDSDTSSPAQGTFISTKGSVRDTVANGTCNNGVEFFAPDKNGDPNSTERIDFYDNGCTAMARDAVRIYSTSGANSETVQRTVSLYALNSTSPSAVRSETVNYINATFDQYGFPVLKDGFARTHTGELSINGVKTIDGDGELVLEPVSGTTSTFCSDSAGFNATGDASLNETFGWAGVMPSGTRTLNSDGTVTWQTTHTGTTYTGAIGGLSIQAGVQNTSCPISTPMFTLAGGTAKGQYTLPVSATYNHGILTNLTIQNATLANGDALNVQTNSGVAPSDPHFISGTLAKSGSTVANFNVDAFGDGVLVVAATGKQYQIEDWHVVKV